MALEDISLVEKKAGFFGGGNKPTLKSILTELQGLRINYFSGFSAGGSADVANMSEAGGDTLLSVAVFGTSSLADITGSASISADRVLLADVNTTSRNVMVMWFNKDNA